MNDLSKTKLLLYIENANKHSLHPCDEDRFAQFVKTSHLVNDDNVDTAIEIQEILIANSFSDTRIDSLVGKYEFGRLLLRE